MDLGRGQSLGWKRKEESLERGKGDQTRETESEGLSVTKGNLYKTSCYNCSDLRPRCDRPTGRRRGMEDTLGSVQGINKRRSQRSRLSYFSGEICHRHFWFTMRDTFHDSCQGPCVM